MQNLTDQIIKAGYSDKTLTEKQLARILGGSSQRRYGLVNRALKAKELVRVQRGLYLLADDYRKSSIHPFCIAQALHQGSYVSFETALAYHNWIPEAVYVTASVIRENRFSKLDHDALGLFTFTPLAIHKKYYLELVERVQLNGQTMLIAKPVRALMDLICNRKFEWMGIEWLEQNLRIDHEKLVSIKIDDITTLNLVYKHKRVRHFLSEFEQALKKEQNHD